MSALPDPGLPAPVEAEEPIEPSPVPELEDEAASDEGVEEEGLAPGEPGTLTEEPVPGPLAEAAGTMAEQDEPALPVAPEEVLTPAPDDDAPYCVYTYEDGSECDNPVLFEADDPEGEEGDFFHSCDTHLGVLIGSADPASLRVTDISEEVAGRNPDLVEMDDATYQRAVDAGEFEPEVTEAGEELEVEEEPVNEDDLADEGPAEEEIEGLLEDFEESLPGES